MQKIDGKNLSKNFIKESNDSKKIPKLIEWLNVHSKGFIAQSLNNNYKNQNIQIKKQNKKIKNNKIIIPIKLTNTISKKGIKYNIPNSNYSSKKTNFTFIIDEEEDFYNKNKPLISGLNNLCSKYNNKIEKLKNEIIKTNKKIKNIDKEEKKLFKNNSLKYISYIKQDDKKIENKKNKKHKHKSVKMNTKISLKKDIKSPLLNYLEKANKNLNQSYFNSINNKNKNIRYVNENSNSGNPNNNQKQKENNTNRENIDRNSGESEMNNRKKNKIRYSKSIKEIKINNINLIEIHKYMIEGRKFKSRKKKYNYIFNNSYKEEMGDYSFDDEEEDKLIMSERKNIISFSEICSSTNNYMTNKKGFNKFFGKSIKNKKDNIKFNLLKSSQF